MGSLLLSTLLFTTSSALLLAPSEVSDRSGIRQVQRSRRQLLHGAAAIASLCAPPLARGAQVESFEGRAQRLEALAQEDAAAQAARARFVREQVTDPFAAARANPGRQRFADELPPMSEAERMQRAEAAQRAASQVRPAPLVSKDEPAPARTQTATPSDEFLVEFDSGRAIGLTLRDLRIGFEYGTTEGTSRVVVADVAQGGQAAGGRVAVDNIVVAVDGVDVQREDAKAVQGRIARARAEGRPVRVTFKDAFAFNERLNSPITKGRAAADGASEQADPLLRLAPRLDPIPIPSRSHPDPIPSASASHPIPSDPVRSRPDPILIPS